MVKIPYTMDDIPPCKDSSPAALKGTTMAANFGRELREKLRKHGFAHRFVGCTEEEPDGDGGAGVKRLPETHRQFLLEMGKSGTGDMNQVQITLFQFSWNSKILERISPTGKTLLRSRRCLCLSGIAITTFCISAQKARMMIHLCTKCNGTSSKYRTASPTITRADKGAVELESGKGKRK
jgi:hypothetical protein